MFAREGEDVLVARSHQENDVAVDCLFWQILFAKQLFSVRLPLMTKFFVMRECDNILSGYLCVVTTVFSQQDGIYGFKFFTRFFGDLLQRSHSFVSFDSFLDLSI